MSEYHAEHGMQDKPIWAVSVMMVILHSNAAKFSVHGFEFNAVKLTFVQGIYKIPVSF